MSLVLIVMGVSGTGKSTVGQALANEFGFDFLDADDYHSEVNKAKMSRAEALTDEDRSPWLASLQKAILDKLDASKGTVLACSALKHAYQEQLLESKNKSGQIKLIFLKASYKDIYERLMQRKNHFMKADMLKSQFATLEPPVNAIEINAMDPIAKIVADVKTQLEESF